MQTKEVRTLGDTLLFTVVVEKDDEVNATSVCWGCPFETRGCSREIDVIKQRIMARVNLSADVVRRLKSADKSEVRCGAGLDIYLKAGNKG